MREHFGLHFLDDHGGAPGRLLLRSQDVAVNVIADVKHAIAGHAHRALEVVQVATLVDHSAFERHVRGVHLFAVTVHDGPAFLEERGLRSRDHEDVEVVSESRVFGHRAPEQVRHHLLGERPPRVREQEEALACRSQLVERLGEACVAVDVARKVLLHLVQDGAVPVGFVDALADVAEELREVHGFAALLEAVDDPGVERRFAERVERVDPVVAPGRRAELLLVVQRAKLVFRKLAKAMVALLDDLVAVHLQDVPEALVDEKPANRKVDAVLNRREHVLRVAACRKLGQGRPDRQVVHLRLVVDGEGVVHVEPHPVDSRHLQVAIHEDAPRPRDPGGTRLREEALKGQFELCRRHGRRHCGRTLPG